MNILHVEMDVVTRMPVVHIQTYTGVPVHDAMTGAPILKSFDAATYTCAEGYSTNGLVGRQNTWFSVSCLAAGVFSRPLTRNRECQPVMCSNYQILSMPNSHIINERSPYRYGQSVHYQCATGHTLSGYVGGQSSYSVPCRADGTFPDRQESCVPIECSVPTRASAVHDAGVGMVPFGAAVTYNCLSGYELGGNGSATIVGTCEADGNLAFPFGAGDCEPVECGHPPSMENVEFLIPDPHAFDPMSRSSSSGGRPYMFHHTVRLLQEVQGGPSEVVRDHKGDLPLDNVTHSLAAAAQGKAAHRGASAHGRYASFSHRRSFNDRRRFGYVPVGRGYTATYMDQIRAQCEDGATLDGVVGGATYYTMQCSSDKTFTTFPGVCSPPLYPVGGRLSDAQSRSRTLRGATVRVLSTDGLEVLDSTTAGYGGLYWVDVPLGTWTFEASKDGYIESRRNITVGGYISAGGIADMALSQVLGEGEWRVLVEWQEHTQDLDAHVYWNDNAAHVYWARTSYRDYSSGISVSLDRDDVSGYGPESLTMSGIGSCTETSRCLVRFMIDNYTPRDGSIGDSDVRVLLYRGNRLEQEYAIPRSVDTPNYDVFTLDAREGQGQAVYSGRRKLPPYFQFSSASDWSQTFDFEMWSWVRTGNVISGFRASSFAYLHDIDEALSLRVGGTNWLECQEVEWDLAGLGWVTCPAGHFLEGLYRTGSRYMRGEGVQQIHRASCCRPQEAPQEWGDCTDEDLFRRSGLSECSFRSGHLKAVTGLHRGSLSTRLDDLDKIRCCALPDMGLLEDVPVRMSSRPF
jgi:hypothetical protein